MLKIKPCDIFLFGDGREFNRGEHTFRQGRFFINPIPILGALNRVVGKKLNIHFIALEKEGKLYFKMPLDVKLTKNGSYIKGSISQARFISEEETKYIVDFKTKEKIKDVDDYVSWDVYRDYLLGKVPDKDVDKLRIYPEIRTGIEIDYNSRVAKDGMLFFQVFSRLEEGSGFFLKTDLQQIEVNWLAVGGEGKGFKVEMADDLTAEFETIKNHIITEIDKRGMFKIILLTPTNFPPTVDGAEPIGRLVGKSIAYSGWMSVMKSNRKELYTAPTRLFRLIPEGSVFYYRLTDRSRLKDIVERFWFKPSFYRKEYPYFDLNRPTGFGLTAITYI